MPLPHELARAYARRLREAIRKDRFARLAFPYKSASDLLAKGNLAVELKSVARDLDSLVYEATGERVASSYKDSITDQVAEELGVRPEQLKISVKSASNDKLFDVIHTLENILRETKDDGK